MDNVYAIWSATTDTVTYLSGQSPMAEESGEGKGESNVLETVTGSIFGITSALNPMTYIPTTPSNEEQSPANVTGSIFGITSALNPMTYVPTTPSSEERSSTNDVLSVNGIFTGLGSGATYMFDMTANLATTLTPNNERVIATNLGNDPDKAEDISCPSNENTTDTLNPYNMTESLGIESKDPIANNEKEIEPPSAGRSSSIYDIMINGPVGLMSAIGTVSDIEQDKPTPLKQEPHIRRISQEAFPLTNTLLSNIFGTVVSANDEKNEEIAEIDDAIISLTSDEEIQGVEEIYEAILSPSLNNDSSNTDEIHYSKILNELTEEEDKKCIHDAFELLDKGIGIKKKNLFKNQDETYKLYCDRQMHTIYWRPNSNDVQGLFSKKKNSERFITIRGIISVHVCEGKNKAQYLSIEHEVRTLNVELDQESLHTVFEALQVICNKVNNVAVVKAAKKTKLSSLLSSKKIVKSN